MFIYFITSFCFIKYGPCCFICLNIVFFHLFVQLPSLGVWLLAANKLHKYILTEASDTTPGQPFTILKNMLDVSMRFSEK